MGLAAIVAPFAYTIVSDVAPPKIRAKCNAMIGVTNLFGTFLTALMTYFFSTGSKYATSDPNLTVEMVY